MVEWYNALSQLEKVFSYIAFPATLILVLQLIMLLIGFGGDSTDVDDGMHDGDGDLDYGDDGLHIFSIRGIVSFFAVFGWTGMLVSKNTDGNVFLSIIIAFAAGLLTMFALAYLIKSFLKLQSDGTLDYKNALGLPATVYITIPPQGAKRVR